MDAEHFASMLDNLNAGLEQVKLTAIVQTQALAPHLLRLKLPPEYTRAEVTS